MSIKALPSLKTLALSTALAASLPLGSVQAADGQDSGGFNAHQFALDNGMQVVVLPNHRAPIVHHMVWYKVGAADEAPGKSGIAHLLEHLMFKGTEENPRDTYSQFVVRHGGAENAFTSNDQTAYHQTIAKEHLPEIMAMEADRMTHLVLKEAEFTSERSVVIEEREQRIGNNPSAKLGEAMTAALYQNHPYGKPVIGWRHEIEGLTREDVLAFYDHWYGPQNAILVVAGDVEPEAVFEMAKSTYGQVAPTAPAVERLRPKEPPQYGQRRVLIEDETVGTSQLLIRYLAPTMVKSDADLFGEGADPVALTVLAYILGGDTTTRLNRRLVEEEKIAVAAGAYYDPNGLDYSGFSAYIVPAPGGDLEAAEAALTRELDLLLSDGVSEDEVATAVRRMTVELVYEQDSLTTGARIIGRALSVGGQLEDVQSYAKRLSGVTKEQVEAAAKAVLKKKQTVVAILRPTPAAS